MARIIVYEKAAGINNDICNNSVIWIMERNGLGEIKNIEGWLIENAVKGTLLQRVYKAFQRVDFLLRAMQNHWGVK